MMHRKIFRGVFQGISQSLARHLDFLTQQWPWEDMLTEEVKQMINKRDECIKGWIHGVTQQMNNKMEAEQTQEKEHEIENENENKNEFNDSEGKMEWTDEEEEEEGETRVMG